ncbi:MAG: hypothetical protein ACI828_002677 [Flavobacteriales bacterium]|jgi:hypothetical protein
MLKYLVFFCALLLVSCEKEVDLFQVEKDKVEREWKVESLIETFISGSLTNSTSDSFLAHFKNNETVTLTYTDRGGIEQVGGWFYQLRPERVIIINNESQFGQLLVPNDYFSVIEKTNTRQIWQYENVDGISTTVKTWTLTIPE